MAESTPGSVHIAWYATGFRAEKLQAALAEIAAVAPQMTTLPNGLTVNTDVGNVALPTCSKTMSGAVPRISRTAFENRRDSWKRAFSSSGVSPPLRIIPANSLRLM